MIGDFGNICVDMASETTWAFLGNNLYHLNTVCPTLHHTSSWNTGLLKEDWKFVNGHLFSKP